MTLHSFPSRDAVGEHQLAALRRLLGAVFDCEDVGGVTVKGFSDFSSGGAGSSPKTSFIRTSRIARSPLRKPLR